MDAAGPVTTPRRKVLYISPNGLTEPHVRSQVLPYLKALSADNEFFLLTFEKAEADPARRDGILAELRASGIHSLRLPYHGWPLGTARVIVAARRLIRRTIRQEGIHILHARSYVPAEAARPLSRRTNVPLLFDMRGFHIDERVDMQRLRQPSLAYRILKQLETRLLRQSAHVVVLTEDAKRLLQTKGRFGHRPPHVDVAPCGADLDRFRPRDGPLPPGLVILYAGSLGPSYDHEGMAKAFVLVHKRHPHARLQILSLQGTEGFQAALSAAGVPPTAVTVGGVTPDEVPARLRAAHAGMCFLTPTFSKRASSPIKVAEYLASGLPVLVTPGAGDYDEFVEKDHVGAVVDPRDDTSMVDGIDRWLRLAQDPATARRCRDVAERRFDVTRISGTYARVYDALSPQGRAPAQTMQGPLLRTKKR